MRLVRQEDRAWAETIGLDRPPGLAALQVGGEATAEAPRELMAQVEEAVTGLRLEPRQLVFDWLPVSDSPGGDFWIETFGDLVRGRDLVDAVLVGERLVYHAAAIKLFPGEFWDKVSTRVANYFPSVIALVPPGLDLASLLGRILRRLADDTKLFMVRDHFPAAVDEFVPAGGIVLRSWLQDSVQFDLVGRLDDIETLAARSKQD